MYYFYELVMLLLLDDFLRRTCYECSAESLP
jgi:hypothetical protein